ncbi:APC family permease [Paenibacillus humicola]|uniref:APC family permease n=1 Tax=Paenibacillus humicola TaxID=3110540 RepID=UPI00237C0363|nr:APC family permease [Paenibacillus humicola]
MKTEVKLNQSLTLFKVVYLGLAWMTPMIYFSIYGIAYDSSGGMLTPAYMLAFAAIFFTAYSYGIMSKTFPTSGSAYTYVRRSIHPYLGFLVGWALLLDYLFSPLIACLTFGIYLHAQFPAVPSYVFIILLNVAASAVNIIGINFSANLSRLFVLIQLVFIAVFCAVLIGRLSGSFDPMLPFTHGDVSLATIMTGASVICFSFLGFDSITTMCEETINARKTIPRAIMIIICSAIVMYVVPSYLTQLVFPHLTFVNPDSAGFEVVKLVGGTLLSSIFITVLFFAIFTQGLSSVTSVSRLLYVFGRDSILPNRIFAYLHPKYRTPVINIVLVAGVSMFALVISLDTAVKFVNFGALTGFVFVNLSVIAKRYIKDRERSFKQTLMYLVFPLTGACFIGWLLSLLNASALWMGGAWLLLGAIYQFVRSRTARSAKPVVQEYGELTSPNV